MLPSLSFSSSRKILPEAVMFFFADDPETRLFVNVSRRVQNALRCRRASAPLAVANQSGQAERSPGYGKRVFPPCFHSQPLEGTSGRLRDRVSTFLPRCHSVTLISQFSTYLGGSLVRSHGLPEITPDLFFAF